MFRLLLAENEYMEREAMKHILKREYGEVLDIMEATNGMEAIEMAKEFHPDIVFMDIKMPGCSGIEATRKIRASLPETLIVFVSAYDCFDYAKEAIALKVEDFLVKPIEVKQVYELIEKCFQKIKKSLATKDKSDAIEMKFSVVKKQYQQELIGALRRYQTPMETIEHYFQVMDLSFQQAMIVYIDFSSGESNGEMIQQGFRRKRYVEKFLALCEKYKIECVTGDLKEYMPFLCLSSSQTGNGLEELVTRLITQCDILLEISFPYYMSKVVTEIKELPEVFFETRQALLSTKGLEMGYPFDLECKLVEATERKEFLRAKEYITQICSIFNELYDTSQLKRVSFELFVMIKRAMIKISKELLLPNADGLIVEAGTREDIEAFYYRLYDYAIQQEKTKPDRNQVLIYRVCDFIDQHYMEDLSLEQVAGVIGFSPFYFTKLMKEYLDMSFVDYLSTVRIRRAKQLLATTQLTVKEVACQVGYEDANYFSRVFKRFEGITPSQYKNYN